MKIEDFWITEIAKMITEDPVTLAPTKVYYDSRYFKNVEINDMDIEKLSFYKDTQNKLNKLKHNYWNQDSLDNAKAEIERKKIRSVSISFEGRKKVGTRMNKQHCLVSGIIDMATKEFTIIFRTSDWCRKFLADIQFIKSEVMPYLNITNYKINLFFNRILMSAEYLWIPYCYMYEAWGLEKFEEILKIKPIIFDKFIGHLRYENTPFRVIRDAIKAFKKSPIHDILEARFKFPELKDKGVNDENI